MDLTLDNREWKEFKIKDILRFKRGKRLIANDRIQGNFAYYSATNTNNGLTYFISNPLFLEKNKIIVTTFCDSYFVEGEFTASDEITMLSNEYLNKYSGRFISRIITSNQSKYAFGRKAFSERLAKQLIILPINSKNEPDYEFMEQYMRHKEQQKHKEYKQFIQQRVNRLKKTPKTVSLKEKKWDEFFLNEIFTQIQRGKRLKKADHIEGSQPYISSTGLNNGLDGYVGNTENVRIFNNCITLANSGSVGSCFYQPFSFVASDHVTKLENKDFSKSVNLFISSIVSRLGVKYSFNREMNDTRIKREKIMLPINENSEPDYKFMENYMKNLEYKKLTEYLKFKKG